MESIPCDDVAMEAQAPFNSSNSCGENRRRTPRGCVRSQRSWTAISFALGFPFSRHSLLAALDLWAAVPLLLQAKPQNKRPAENTPSTQYGLSNSKRRYLQLPALIVDGKLAEPFVVLVDFFNRHANGKPRVLVDGPADREFMEIL